MAHRGPFLFLIVLLVIAGIGTAIYRHNTFAIPFSPDEEQLVWQVEARVQFTANGEPTNVYLALPPDQSGFRIVDASRASSGFGYAPGVRGGQLQAHWSKREVIGDQSLFYKLEIVADQNYSVPSTPPAIRSIPSWREPYGTAARQLLETALPLSAGGLSLAEQLSQLMSPARGDQNASLLLGEFSAPELLQNLLLTADVPARTVQVLKLEDGRRRQDLTTYVQVYENETWQLFDAQNGRVHDTSNLLLWLTDAPSVLDILGGRNSRVSLSMIRAVRPALAVSQEQYGDFGVSLYSLPIAEQGVFKLIMLMPIGALVVVFMRIIVGFKTSGTFMPVLIALAFLQTELLPGLASFLLVVGIGLMIRYYLSNLNLLLVARIAVLVLIVIGIITTFSVLSYRLGLIEGLNMTFFPMIILAWTIERMSITWEENGPKEVLAQVGGSLLVATIAYLAMSTLMVSHLAFNFPELHMVLLAIILALGRYTGYRLLELRRFAAFKSATSESAP